MCKNGVIGLIISGNRVRIFHRGVCNPVILSQEVGLNVRGKVKFMTKDDMQNAIRAFREGRSQCCAAELCSSSFMSATISSNWTGQAIEN